ncbi:MAG: NADH-quinone oxidoreductase subunit NuoH [Actinomycetota bacterium]
MTALLLAVIKVAVVFGAILGMVLFIIWFERKVVAHMQSRYGPNRWGPFGLFQSLADGIKLFFKEPITPRTVEKVTFLMAPIISLVPAFLAFAAIPFGTEVRVLGETVRFEVADLNIGLLWVVAMGSLAVYGVVLAGWSSGSKYPLLGGIRSSAQMISYEIALSLSLVPVVVYAGTLSMREIVEAQAGFYGTIEWLPGFLEGIGKFIPRWFVFLHMPAFLVFLLAGVAETNRAPFDLPEAETELVAGFHTEYSGIKFAMFFLAEYVHVITISALAALLFLGGWDGPQFGFLPWVWPLSYFVGKTFFFVFLFVWLRATMPRLRYDRLMTVGWKFLIPISLIWVFVSAALTVVEVRL